MKKEPVEQQNGRDENKSAKAGNKTRSKQSRGLKLRIIQDDHVAESACAARGIARIQVADNRSDHREASRDPQSCEVVRQGVRHAQQQDFLRSARIEHSK